MTKKNLDRKDFLKSTFTGLAGMTFLGSTVAPKPRYQETEDDKVKFIYRTLGKTGIKVPIVSLGVMNAQNPALVRAALDAGITHLDTAHGYQRGRNEEMIGKVIRNRPRDSYTIATKVPPIVLDSDQQTVAEFRRRLDLSLRRLGLKYVDILYLHGADTPEEAMDPLFLETLAALKTEGKTRFVGVSVHDNEQHSIRAAIESKVYDVVLTAYNFKQVYRDEIKQAIAEAAAAGLGIVAMKTMVGGWMDEEETIPVNAKAALKWVLQDTNVHTTIPGCITFDQMHTNLSVMADLAFTKSEKADLELHSSLPGIYCQGCTECVPDCRQRLPIPTIMRAYMYTYGYRNLSAAQDLVTSLDLPAKPCKDCTECAIKCVKGFDVAHRVRDVARLRDVPREFLA
ncbi:aldo/keto reductase [Candidatus Neomarinimicrobiota bacterium]